MSDMELQMVRALAAIDAELGMPEDGCNSPAMTLVKIKQWRAALLSCARKAEALKRDCISDPESWQAERNAQYQAIATTAHIALGTIRGPQAVETVPQHATEPMQKAMQRAVLMRKSMNDVWRAALAEAELLKA